MGYEWSAAEYAKLSPAVQRVRLLLDDWFLAMEDGRVKDRRPDPAYRPSLDEETVNRVIAHIDDRMAYELGAWARQLGFDDTPRFGERLSASQKLALIQQIRDAIRAAQGSE